MGNVPTHITTETKYSSNYKSSRLGWSLNRFFGIRREESATVRMFFLHHFFLGLGQMMFFFGAITKFLENLKPIDLAKVFGFSAIVLMVVGRIYSYFEHHIPFKKLLPRVLLFLIFMTIALRFALYFLKDDYMLKLFEVAFFVVYLLSNLEFWGLSALVFDVRQGKRLFSLISAGDVPAKLLGYVCVSLFVPKEKENLLFISAIAFIISYFILENLLPKIDVGHAHHHHPDHIFVLITTVPGMDEIQHYVNKLCSRFPETKILLTGYQVVGQDIETPENCQIINNVSELLEVS